MIKKKQVIVIPWVVCPPVCGDNPQALASGLSYIQADNLWYNYFIQPTFLNISVDLAHHEIFHAIAGKGDINERKLLKPLLWVFKRTIALRWLLSIHIIWAATYNYHLCGILTNEDSDEPVNHLFKLRNAKCCFVSSLTVIEYSSN